MSLTAGQLLFKVRQQIQEVTAAQVHQELQAGVRLHLIDIREREELGEGYLPGAALIPRGFLELSIEKEVTADRKAPIVLYCASGSRSALAARDLAQMGYSQVRSLSGGFRAWKEAGFEIEKGGLLSEAERQRYSRHLLLPEVGEQGQRKLLQARVLVVGVGGLGCPTSLYLAAAGVGTLGLVDADVVDRSNLQRQILFGEADLGRPKVEVARERLLDLNPGIAVRSYRELLTSDNIMDIAADYDIIVNGCDNFPTRYLVNDAAVLSRKPVVDGSIFRFEGQATVYLPGQGPCYRCLYPEPPPPGEVPSCAEGGVLGVLPGLISLIQATEVAKLILAIGNPLIGRMLVYDALEMSFRVLKMQRNPACLVCGDHPTITRLIDYQEFCGLPSHRQVAG